MIVGIAYHSPLDIVALLPTNVTYTIHANCEADVFISDKVEKEFKAKIQIVFTSARSLFSENLPIIDQGSWGKIITLTGLQIEELLNKQIHSAGTPDWVNKKRGNK